MADYSLNYWRKELGWFLLNEHPLNSNCFVVLVDERNDVQAVFGPRCQVNVHGSSIERGLIHELSEAVSNHYP